MSAEKFQPLSVAQSAGEFWLCEEIGHVRESNIICTQSMVPQSKWSTSFASQINYDLTLC
eukprot:6213416-Pleurochrysis_carterae.AAC.5